MKLIIDKQTRRIKYAVDDFTQTAVTDINITVDNTVVCDMNEINTEIVNSEFVPDNVLNYCFVDGLFVVADVHELAASRASLISRVRQYATEMLSETDYYIIRRAETGKSVPQEILNARQNIRAWCNAQEKTVMALATLEEVITFKIKY